MAKGKFGPPSTLTPTEAGAEYLKRGKEIQWDEKPSCRNCRNYKDVVGLKGCVEMLTFPHCKRLPNRGYRRK